MNFQIFPLILLLTLTTGIFSACEGLKPIPSNVSWSAEQMEYWKGKHKAALQDSLGPCSRTQYDGKGGEILIYERRRTVGKNIRGNYVQVTEVYFREFYTDKAGIIYDWKKGIRE